MYKNVVIFLVLISIVSCGYRIVGIDTNIEYRFLLDRVVSLDKESDYFALLDDETKSFLNSYNALALDDNSYDYNLKIVLQKVTTESSIITRSSQTVQTDLKAIISINVVDKHNKKVFGKDYSSVQTYNITNNISQNIDNRNSAFRKTVRNILLDFLHDFQKDKK